MKAEEGAAAVELGLVLPLLLLMVGGVIDFGFAFNAQISLTHAAREGVRVEALGIDDGGVVAQDRFVAPMTTGTTTDVQPCPAPPAPDAEARVTISADYDFIILPLGNRTFSGEAVMRCGG